MTDVGDKQGVVCQHQSKDRCICKPLFDFMLIVTSHTTVRFETDLALERQELTCLVVDDWTEPAYIQCVDSELESKHM